MCKHLKELSEIKLENVEVNMTGDNLLELIRNAEKLQKLNVFLDSDAYILDIPAELLEIYSMDAIKDTQRIQIHRWIMNVKLKCISWFSEHTRFGPGICECRIQI